LAAFASPRAEAESLAVDADTGALLDRLDVRAIEHGDEHVVKLTEASRREFSRTENPTLLVAADRFRDRIPAPADRDDQATSGRSASASAESVPSAPTPEPEVSTRP